MKSIHQGFLLAIYALCSLLFTACLSAEDIPEAHKDDVIVFENGDRLTGEILSLDHGILYFRSDRAVGNLEIDWTRVVNIQSRGRYEFESRLGIRRIGRIVPTPEPSNPPTLSIALEEGAAMSLNLSDIVGIREMKKSRLGRVDFSIEAGANYTKGNDQIQVNTHASFIYDHPIYSIQLQGNSLISGQSEGERTSRHEFQALGTRYLSNHWNYIVLGSLLNDVQQNLDLRAVIGGGLQRFLKKTPRTIFAVSGGAVYTNENYSSELDSDRNNAELLAGFNVSTYKFRSSELTATAFVFPSLSEWGRVRIDTNAYIKWEVVSDLYWKISFFDNFDSDPPPGTIENNFGITSSLGWTF